MINETWELFVVRTSIELRLLQLKVSKTRRGHLRRIIHSITDVTRLRKFAHRLDAHRK